MSLSKRPIFFAADRIVSEVICMSIKDFKVDFDA